MALNAFLACKGETQGDIKGSCDINPHEDKIEVWGFSHEVVSPRDAASNAPTGKRQHKPFTITKPVDKSSPLLMNVLVNNERVTEWKLQIYRPSPTGSEEEYYNIELADASIASIRQESLNNKYPENMAHPYREHISFTYQKITWTWMDGGVTSVDEWKVQRS
jgi:type VI secretion system secreted protein Hcp